MQHNIETKKESAKMSHHIKYVITVVALVAVIVLSNSVFAQTQNPPLSPALPQTLLNISGTAQQKAGWLGLGMTTSSAMPTAVVDVMGTMIADVLGVLGNSWITEKLHIGGTTIASLPQNNDPTLVVEGSRIRSLVLSGSGERPICADADGRLTLCGAAPQPAPVDAVCGDAASYYTGGQGTTFYDNFQYSALANPYLCKVGTPIIPVSQQGGGNNGTGGVTTVTLNWTCQGINGGQSASCSTEPKCPVINGQQTGCFLPGTMVTLADGTQKPIEDIAIDDGVKSLEGKSNTVVNTINHQYVGWVYGINGSKPFVTANHPMLTPEGWKSFDPELTAKTEPELTIVGGLKKGDILIKQDGSREKIKSYTREWMNTTVYNLTVSGNHVYYADEYAVHNAVGTGQNGCVLPTPPPDTPEPADPGPLCSGTVTNPSCNVSSVAGAISAVPYTYTKYDEAACGTPIFYGYGCTITYSQTNNLGNNVVSQVNCTDFCKP